MTLYSLLRGRLHAAPICSGWLLFFLPFTQLGVGFGRTIQNLSHIHPSTFMKKLIFALLFGGLVVACQKSDDNSANPTSTLSGTRWVVSLYQDHNKGQLGYFNGYTFDFTTDGKVTATSGSQKVNGTWQEVSDSGKQKFYLNFGSTSPFDELNEDWIIIVKTSTKIELENQRQSGSGTPDKLHFSKQ